jgi:plasmid segregation protein ParM
MFNEPTFGMKKPVVIGVDTGYSSTKYAFVSDGEVTTGSFPSISVRAPQTALTAGMEEIGAREADIRIVLEGGETFMVDTLDSEVVSTSTTRSENDDFATTKEYRTLVLTALVKCGFRNIDLLTLGLPFHTFHAYAPLLIKKFRGVHTFGHGTFTVKDVAVLPQPLGSYAYLRATAPDAFVNGTSCAIIDSGWGTTDTFVSSASFKIDRQRCGGLPGGAALVLREIASRLQANFKGRFTNIDRIDRAIAQGTPLYHNGEQIDLKPYLQDALHVTIPVCRSVLTTLRTTEDLTIFAAGGAGHYYLATLRDVLGCKVRLLDQPRFTNAIGFLLAGQSACKARS